ncbi:hypothetical protein PF005_g26909 [Phytophthora fragariae]|uniref:Uncharacterized protein n=1 Tax=Phytophthora fragariae TaxID=53985 RepID=A0A6A3QY22_9STRA|nr:hypothetical protein PF009_g27552 [Phytophthora fragariae]KAE8971945.1 hypothetical protein PF011_g25838 [Phytophthora fragariae]KAE9070098.1 hypothetical protein PF010_g26417 [Phytophthora fragariae]KAE9070594.1 hypothetical protein PF007_g26886 [Phytophthora fragariae]KAE9084850.1 hypothetical protein PF006_g26385 [Phytophthora fragariae]
MDPPTPGRQLPCANVVLFLVQIAVVVGVFLFAPAGSWAPSKAPNSHVATSGAADSSGSLALVPDATPTASTLTPNNPLAPAAYVLYIWVPIYVFTGITVATDRFYPSYSFYLTSDDPSFLRQWFQLSCLANMAWVALDMWFSWVHMATFALGVLWCTVLPLYLFVVRHPTPRYSQAWIYYFCSEFSVRLYFGWLSADVIFGIADVMQYLHGAYFGFSVYAVLLGALLHTTFPGETQEVFEKLRAVAIVVAPVFPILVFIDSVRYVYVVHWKAARAPRGSDEYYKPFVFETTAEYGTV